MTRRRLPSSTVLREDNHSVESTKASMPEKPRDEMMPSVAHFIGLRLSSASSSSAPSSPSFAMASQIQSSDYSSCSPVTSTAEADSPGQPFVIGVSGGTASGKTTVCDMIIQQLHDHRVVCVNQNTGEILYNFRR